MVFLADRLRKGDLIFDFVVQFYVDDKRTPNEANDIPDALNKVRNLRAMVGGRPIDIEIDGGITPQIAPEAARAGANAFVAGSAVFKGGAEQSYRANITAIREAAAAARGEIV